MTQPKRPSSAAAGPSGLSSLFDLPTSAIAERLSVLLATERRPHYQCRDYLRDGGRKGGTRSSSAAPTSRSASPSSTSKRERVRPSSRGKIVRWLCDIVDYLELDRDAVAVAMGFVDRFMSSAAHGSKAQHRATASRALEDVTHYQLLAISSLLIASKRDDKATVVTASLLANVSHGSYSADEITSVEKAILDALEWRLCGPTPLGVAYHAIALLGKGLRDKRRRRMASVVDFARLQIELAAADYDCGVLRPPSAVALAGVLNAMELLDFSSRERRAFDRRLSVASGLDLHSEDVEEARTGLRRVFESRTSDVVAGRARAAGDAAKDAAAGSFHTASSSRSPVSVDGLQSETTPRRRRERDARKKGRESSRRRPRHLEP